MTSQDPAASTRAPVASRRAALLGGPAAPGSPPLAAGGKMSRRAQAPQLPAPDGARTSSRATPRDQALRDGTREEAPQSPAGAAPASPREASSAVPAGSRGLRGAEWQAAAARASRRRPARGAPRAAARVTIPPPATGAALTATATCLGRCDWTAGPGDPAEVDKAAEDHATKPPKHPTNVVAEVAEIGGTA